MLRPIIIVCIVLVFAGVLTWLYRAFQQYRSGSLQPDVPGSVREPHHLGYEIVEQNDGTSVTIAVHDPHGREIKSWTVDMTVDSAADDLHNARADARALHGELDV